MRISGTPILMPRPVPIFEGKVIRLRPISPDLDAEAWFRFSLDPELHRWTGNATLPSVAAAREELRHLADDPYLSVWSIGDRNSGEFVGRFFLCLQEWQGQRVVGEGNRIARKFWRKGHNREARGFMFHYAFEALQANVYETEVWEPNTNSVQSIEAHGFRLIGNEERLNPKYGQTFIVRHDAMKAAEWTQIQRRTLAR